MIICGIATTTVPNNLYIPANYNSVQALTYIIWHHSGLFIQLAIKRLVTFFGIYRSYYSTIHNLFAVSYFCLIYISILSGIKFLLKNNRPEVFFFIVNIILMAITVMLSCDEWHSRFMLSELPFLLLLATISLKNVFHKNDTAGLIPTRKKKPFLQ
jgi:hypothetical protein